MQTDACCTSAQSFTANHLRKLYFTFIWIIFFSLFKCKSSSSLTLVHPQHPCIILLSICFSSTSTLSNRSIGRYLIIPVICYCKRSFRTLWVGLANVYNSLRLTTRALMQIMSFYCFIGLNFSD